MCNKKVVRFTNIMSKVWLSAGRVILMEKSDLEAERVALFESVMQNQRSMKELESNLLHRLTSTKVIGKFFFHKLSQLVLRQEFIVVFFFGFNRVVTNTLLPDFLRLLASSVARLSIKPFYSNPNI